MAQLYVERGIIQGVTERNMLLNEMCSRKGAHSTCCTHRGKIFDLNFSCSHKVTERLRKLMTAAHRRCIMAHFSTILLLMTTAVFHWFLPLVPQYVVNHTYPSLLLCFSDNHREAPPCAKGQHCHLQSNRLHRRHQKWNCYNSSQ